MLKKGDIVRITFRDGQRKFGRPVRETLERAEVLGIDKEYLHVSVRNTDDPNGDVVLEEMSIPLTRIDLSKL
jgi:hypothetical protein